EQAAYDSARKRFDDLELELRGADGVVIPTEDIHIRDGDFVLTMVDDWPDSLRPPELDLPDDLELEDIDFDDEEIEEAVKQDLELLENEWGEGEEWKRDPERANRPLSRYQIQIVLVDHD